MKTNIENQGQPLPKDKPVSYGDEKQDPKKSSKGSGTRQNKGAAKIKSDHDSPQKVREKLEYDHKKKERDPGMTRR